MPITPPPDKKQEQARELSATPWLDAATESSPAAKLLRKLAREKRKAGDVARIYAPYDWIIDHLGPFSR